MAALEQVKEMMERVTGSARVETVYGEPREVAGKTIIPVARVMYGGGGGGGTGKAEQGQEGGGGGGGLGMGIHPLGIFVITDKEERWVPVIDITRMVIAGTVVLVTGLVTIRKAMLWRRQRRWRV